MYFAVPEADNVLPRNMSPEVQAALRGVRFIAQHIKDADKDNEVMNIINRVQFSARLRSH